ncbi:hypothetical protein KVR01_004268 [Diaporthe batatas]|uniref:uncharacterized protein n=1 Tax=Diaporthe batatas TaxID=748121 RepID=UPI001D04E0DE|nr:uncharacterized protein KVR01_004268 [Diaporthe batatas]KAG8165716.1 hypothetical protein KVR01_004268 [Diaporthe batatas]
MPVKYLVRIFISIFTIFGSPFNCSFMIFTSCSQYGFCGTTAEFCGKGCQSNCVEHPKPSGKTGKTLNRVIGYWEAWNDRSTCHKTSASDLPLDALTHVNYAFAYIDPSTFQITTMDVATAISTFDDIGAIKVTNPDIQIFVSLGGWTFSDNDTVTQPVFGNIAGNAANRQKFATNLLSFLTAYGFDGVDLDWEYPGAPDRGGKKDDTKNYVELCKTLRETFDKSGRTLGITFTAPSSFWYLRWFDLPGMMKYVDWLNFMTYDLHGVWDSTNPISGSIVQGHTNLTEIKLATELLWRVGLSPSQVALGFGFYGRSFTLADPSCTKPGCPFSGGGAKGVCTGTSGCEDFQVIHDKEAAVKYFSWDKNQWISFDDEETFKQKVDWGNDIGFGGSLIWASDLGFQFLGQGCYVFSITQDDINQYACDRGYERVGEVKIAGSSWGGKPGESGTGRCSRGGKAFCCDVGIEALTDDCYWTECGASCKGDDAKVAHAYDKDGKCLYDTGLKRGEGHDLDKRYERYLGGNTYCCKKDRIAFNRCNWVGKGDCADNTCDRTEVTLLTNPYGDSSTSCNWWRSKALCCQPNQDTLQTLDCDADLCADNQAACDDEAGYDDSDGFGSVTKRSYISSDGRRWNSYSSSLHLLEDRAKTRPGDRRKMILNIPKVVGSSIYGVLNLESIQYPPGAKMFSGDGASTVPIKGGFAMASDLCDSISVKFIAFKDLPSKGFNAEHMQEIKMVPQWLTTALTGVLPSGKKMQAAVIDPQKLIDLWNKDYSVSLPKIGVEVNDVKNLIDPITPNDRIFTIIGAFAYRIGMTFIPADMNLIKRDILGGNNPQAIGKFNKNLKAVVNSGDMDAAKMIIGPLQKTFGVFNILNDAYLADYFDQARGDFLKEVQHMHDHMPGLEPLLPIWIEFEKDYYETAATFAQNFILTRTSLIAGKFLGVPTGALTPAAAKLTYEAAKLATQVAKLKFQKKN